MLKNITKSCLWSWKDLVAIGPMESGPWPQRVPQNWTHSDAPVFMKFSPVSLEERTPALRLEVAEQ